MSLFVLRKGFRVVSTPGGGRVVHARTGDELNLTPEEIQLLARASAGGLDGDDPSLRPLIKKFASLGILAARADAPAPTSAPAPPSVPPLPQPAAAAPSPMLPQPSQPLQPTGSSVSPRLRSDLSLSQRPSSSLVDITHPTSKRTFTLYDFELSLARMLDGTRTYAQVVDAGQRLGIPVSIQSLSQFIRQLEQYGFISVEGTPKSSGDGSLWAPRQKWDDALRSLFQSALRMHRQGRYDEALGYLHAILEQDPQNPEALQMVEKVQRRVASDAAGQGAPAAPAEGLPVDLGDLLGEETPRPFSAFAPEVAKERGDSSFWRTEVAPEVLRGRADEESGPAPTHPSPGAPKPRRRLLWAAAATLGVLTVGAGLFFWQGSGGDAPLAAALNRAASPPRAAPQSRRAEARTVWRGGPAAGTDAGVSARPPPAPTGAVASTTAGGALGDALAHVDSATRAEGAPPAAAGPSDAGAHVESAPKLEAAPAVALATPPAAPSKPDAPVGDGKPWLSAEVSRRGRVKMAEVIAPADGVVTWSTAARERVARGALVGSLSAGSKHFELTAGKAGVLIPTSSKSAAKRGQVLAAVLYHEAFLQTVVRGKRPSSTWACQVFHPATGQRADCKVVTAVPREDGFFVTATTEPLWFDDVPPPVLLQLSPKP